MINKKYLLLIMLIVISCSAQNEKKQNKSQSQQTDSIVEQVIAFIGKSGFKILVSPAILRVNIKIIVQKLIKVSLTKTVLKKIPVLGVVAGFAYGGWRLYKGQNKRAAAQFTSGLLGATGVGVGLSIAADVGILIADVVEELKILGYIKQQKKIKKTQL